MDDVLKQNPDLMNQFANAAINQMNEEWVELEVQWNGWNK